MSPPPQRPTLSTFCRSRWYLDLCSLCRFRVGYRRGESVGGNYPLWQSAHNRRCGSIASLERLPYLARSTNQAACRHSRSDRSGMTPIIAGRGTTPSTSASAPPRAPWVRHHYAILLCAGSTGIQVRPSNWIFETRRGDWRSRHGRKPQHVFGQQFNTRGQATSPMKAVPQEVADVDR
jgi:hypothetical protein